MTNPYTPLLQRMADAGLADNTPGFQIVKAAKMLPPKPGSGALIGDNDQAALRKLMKAFYAYGRSKWTWQSTSPGSANNGGLVKGSASACACGTFNWNFRWLAENALGVTGMGVGQDTTQFITTPGGVCIDSKWKGNVRTAKQGFDQMKCFKFYGHYWVTHGGVNYDVCFNNTFGGTGEIIWTKLVKPDAAVLKKTKRNEKNLFKLAKPLPVGDHLVMVKDRGVNGWPEWQIVKASEVPPA